MKHHGKRKLMNNRERLYKNIAALTMLVTALTGCVTTDNRPPSELVNNHGYLVGAFQSREMSGLELQSDDGKHYSVYADNRLLTHREFGAWVPAGKYQITRVLSPAGIKENYVKVKKNSLPEVEVKAHGVTDLGNLFPINLGGGEYSIVWRARTNQFVPKVVRENQSIFYPNNFLTWSASGKLSVSHMHTASSGLGLIVDVILAISEASQRGEAIRFEDMTHENSLQYFQLLGSPSTRLHSDGDNFEYFGTTLGSIRYKNGKIWRVIRTGSLEAVAAVHFEQDGKILVALESGELIVSTDTGVTWQQLASLHSGELAFDIKIIEGTYYVSTWSPDATHGVELGNLREVKPVINIYRLNDAELKSIASIEGKQMAKMYLGWGFVKPKIETHGTSMLVYAPLNTLAEFSTVTGSVRKIDSPQKMHGFSYNDKANLLVVWVSGGIFSKAHFSDNMGMDWHELIKPSYQPREIHLETPTKGHMWSESINANSTNYELTRMDTNNNQWEAIIAADKSCASILSNYQMNRYYCVYPSGVIVELSGNRVVRKQ